MARASARRHAQAVFQIALENNQIEEWRSELRALAGAFADRDLVALLENPKVKLDDKIGLINRCLPGASQLALNLAYLLVVRGRLGIVEELVTEYEKLADAHLGVEHAEITTAVPLDEENKEKVTQGLSSIMGTKIVLSTRTNPGVVGGFVARIGDRVIDGSLRHRLEELKQSLTKAGT